MAYNWAIAILLVLRSICLSTEVVYREKPEDTIVILHDTSQLNCSFDVPPQNVEWIYSNGGISIDYMSFRDEFEVVGESSANEYHLRIESTTLTEEDNYECRDYLNNSITTSAYIYVITSGPDCSANPGYTVIEKEDVHFTCTMSKAVPPGELIWIMNNEVVSRENESLVHVWTHSFHREENGAVLDCSLNHHTLQQPLPSCEEEIIIDVQYLSDFNMTVFPHAITTEGKDVSIDCLALGGNPGPYQMTLSHNNETIDCNDDGLDIHHTITSMSRTHAGVYKCEAFTRFYDSSENHWVHEEEIVVHYSPDISAEEVKFEVPLGSFVELVCTANALPTPTITWIDSDDNVIPDNEENRNITTIIPDETTATSTLTVTVVDESYYGIYTCEASNEIPPSVQLDMRISEPGGSSAAPIAVTVTLVIVVVVAVVIIAVYMYKRSKNKMQYSGNDNESSGLDDVVGQNADTVYDNRLEPEGLSNDHTINHYAETAPSTISSITTPEAAYAVSVKQKRTSSKKSTNETGQNMTGGSNPDPAGLYAVSSKQKDSYEKKEKPKAELTYAELDLTNSGSKQQQNKPPEAERTQYASIQIPKTD